MLQQKDFLLETKNLELNFYSSIYHLYDNNKATVMDLSDGRSTLL